MDIQRNFDLRSYNTFGVSAKADRCTVLKTEQDLLELIDVNKQLNLSLFPLGGGSNILLRSNLDKWVLINEMKGIEVVRETEDKVWLEVMGGENWHEFVLYCLDKGWFGLENLSLIPGSVGASPIQNIGAYGVEVKAFIEEVKAIGLKDGKEFFFSNAEMKFAYRNSIFKHEWKGKVLITRVTFCLSKKANVNNSYRALQEELDKRSISDPSPKEISEAVIAVRQSKLPDPKEIGNSGSFFKNPIVSRALLNELSQKHPNIPNYPVDEEQVKLAAGWLIEQAGWKGYREGEVGVHVKQALVLVNYGKGSGEEIFQLSQRIIDDVKVKFGVELEREVNIL